MPPPVQISDFGSLSRIGLNRRKNIGPHEFWLSHCQTKSDNQHRFTNHQLKLFVSDIWNRDNIPPSCSLIRHSPDSYTLICRYVLSDIDSWSESSFCSESSGKSELQPAETISNKQVKGSFVDLRTFGPNEVYLYCWGKELCFLFLTETTDGVSSSRQEKWWREKRCSWKFVRVLVNSQGQSRICWKLWDSDT